MTLKNRSFFNADISGWTIGDKNDPVAYSIPQGTILLPDATIKIDHNKLGFGIKYPEDWVMQDDTEKEINSALRFYPSEVITQMEANTSETINFFDFIEYTSITLSKYNRISETLKEEVDNFMESFSGYSIENITVNELNGFKLSRQAPDNEEVTQINIFLEAGNGTIHIEIHGSEVDKYLDTFNKFISTFYLL